MTIKIKINDKEVEMTPEAAKRLYDELAGIFGSSQPVAPIDRVPPTPYPWYPWQPLTTPCTPQPCEREPYTPLPGFKPYTITCDNGNWRGVASPVWDVVEKRYCR